MSHEFSESDRKLALQMVMSGEAAGIAVKDSWGEIDFEQEVARVAGENGWILEVFRSICLRERQKRRSGRT